MLYLPLVLPSFPPTLSPVMKALSLDLRERIVKAYNRGEGSYQQLAQRFGVSKPSVERFVKHWRTTGSLLPKAHAGGRPRSVKADEEPLVEQWVEATNDLTQSELAQRFETETGRVVSPRTMGRLRARLDFTRKKRR